MGIRTSRSVLRSGLTGRKAVILAALSLQAACGEGTQPVLGPSSIQVTSPVDTVLAVGRSAQLAATARDASGNTVSPSLAWSSSNASAASVGSAGLVNAVATGSATITASASGVSGTLRVRVVQADLGSVLTLAGDAYAASLLAGLSTSKRAAVQPLTTACSAAATSGNVVAITTCISGVRNEVVSATDQTDKVLLAVLALYIDQIERLLNL